MVTRIVRVDTARAHDGAHTPPILTSEPPPLRVAPTGLERAAAQDHERLRSDAPGASTSREAAPVSAAAARTSTAASTLIARLFARADALGDAPAYAGRGASKNDWTLVSWRTYAQQARDVAKALHALGLGKGDLAVIYAANSPEWALADLGLMTLGAASAGAYPDLGGAMLAHIVNDTQAKVLFIEDAAKLKSVQADVDALKSVQHIVIMSGEKPAHPKALTFAEFVARGAGVTDVTLEEQIAKVKPSDLATLIYTSGTTGLPKGVMLSHENLAFAGTAMQQMTGAKVGDTTICFMRLGHIADRAFSLAGAISAGITVYFSSNIARDVASIEPTLLLGVPRFWDAMVAKVDSTLAKKTKDQTGLSGFVAKHVLALMKRAGRTASEQRNGGKTPGGMLYAQASKRLFAPVKSATGLSRARVCATGAAPISPSTLNKLAELDVQLMNAYGQSETAGIISACRPGDNAVGSVGKPPAGVQVRIAKNGEILVRGPNVFLGYYRNAKATDEVLVDGWLHTGDTGHIDAQGNLHILGRLKRSFKLQSGEWVNPEPIEAALRGGVIGETVVVGRDKKQLGALILLEPEAAKTLAREHGGAEGALHENPAVIAAVQAELARANAGLEGFNKVRKVFIVDRALVVGDGGEVTPTGKLRVFEIEKNFSKQIDAMLD